MIVHNACAPMKFFKLKLIPKKFLKGTFYRSIFQLSPLQVPSAVAAGALREAERVKP